MTCEGFHRSVPLPDVDEVTRDSGRCGHRRADEMRAATLALATLEIAIGRAGAPLARLQDVRVHAQAHAAPGFAPLEASVDEDAVEAFLFRSNLHLMRAWHDHGAHARMHLST